MFSPAGSPSTTSEPIFGTAEDYHELNQGAHRKRPKVLSAPSVVRHLAFWTGGWSDPQAESPQTQRQSCEKKAVDRFIMAFAKSVSRTIPEPKLKLGPLFSNRFFLFDSVYDAVTLEPIESPNPTKRENDVFTSTNRYVIMEFTWRKLKVTVRFELHAEYFSISTFIEFDGASANVKPGEALSLDEVLTEKIKRIECYFRTDFENASQRDREASWINGFCFHDLWDEYDKVVYSDYIVVEAARGHCFRQVFADLRGVIASDRVIKFSDWDFFATGDPPRWGPQAKQRLLPLVQHRDGDAAHRHECAVNYLLNGRAFYISTLGPQLLSMTEDRRVPVEFVVYAQERFDGATVVNKWELGRVVSQILLLGSLRLCALKDIKALHEVSRRLSHLDEVAQAAREAIASTGASAKHAEAPAPTEVATSRDAMYKIAESHSKLNAITGDFLKRTGSGLSYRIERSRSYVKQFEDNLELLQIKRIEGDQSYDEFVKRRLGSEFDFIDRLGRRYERATSTIVMLDQNYLAINQNAMVMSTKGIQEWGEFLLIAILVPYYAAHLIVIFIREELEGAFVLGMWLMFSGIAARRKFGKAFGVRDYLAFLAFVGAVGLTLWSWGILRPPHAPHGDMTSQGVPAAADPKVPGAAHPK